MSTSRDRLKRDWLIGSWQANQGYIPVLFTIAKTAKGFRIRACDQSDGEELVISKVKWDGKSLTFETLTPSNRWRTRNRLTVVSKTKAIHELTFWEDWEKVATRVQPRKRQRMTIP